MGSGRAPTFGSAGRRALVGLIAIAAVLAIGVVSYRANRGLPLQSWYRVNVEVPDAAKLVVNNPVRIGGVRVGQVDRIEVVSAPDDPPPRARLELRLEPSVGPLPADTRVQVRTGSPIGGAFVELYPGQSPNTIGTEGLIPLRNANKTVQITDLLDIFDEATRNEIRNALAETGQGLAGRGQDLGRTIGNSARLMAPAGQTLRTLAAPETELARMLRGYEATIAAIDPVAGQLGSLLGNSATTFEALDRDPKALSTSLQALQPAEASATRALRQIEPSLRGLTTIATELRPGVRLADDTVAGLDSTLQAARQPLREVPRFGSDLGAALHATAHLSRIAPADGSVRLLTELNNPLDKLFSVLTPAQVYCNLFGVFSENAGSVLGATGTAEGAFEFVSVTTLGATNELFQNSQISPDLNVNAVPNLNAKECETNNEPYSASDPNRGNPPGLQYNHFRDTSQPPGVAEKARKAGLYDSPGESK